METVRIFLFVLLVALFGASNGSKDEIIPFKINISEDQLLDLHRRLDMAIIPPKVARKGIPNELGLELDDLSQLLAYWRHSFNWREREELLNRVMPQFITNIDGVQLHFVHIRSTASNRSSTPVLLVHGWPSTPFDFLDVAQRLTDPAQFGDVSEAVDVIIPSMPGYAFSGPPVESRFGAKQIAVLYSKLVRRLGYGNYVASGGDWGSLIVPLIALHEESLGADNRLIGIHVNGIVAAPPITWNPITTTRTLLAMAFPSIFHDKFDQLKLKFASQIGTEISYFLQQVTKPVTLGTALANSPVAVAAWLLEKFVTWTDCSESSSKPGHKADSLEDYMLTTISVYWFTNTITTSVMMYHNTIDFNTVIQDFTGLVARTPTAVADFPADVIWSPLSWARHAFTNIIQYNRLPTVTSVFDTSGRSRSDLSVMSGGHFAAMEEPVLLSQDILLFMSKLKTMGYKDYSEKSSL